MGGQTDSQVGSQFHTSCIKSHIYFKHIQLTCDQLVSTCVGWLNAEKRALICVDEFELNQRQRKPPNETQIERNQVESLR